MVHVVRSTNVLVLAHVARLAQVRIYMHVDQSHMFL